MCMLLDLLLGYIMITLCKLNVLYVENAFISSTQQAEAEETLQV